MISQVEVANPGFSEALISLAGLGKAIDQSLRQIAVPAAAKLAPIPQTSPGSGHAGSGEPSAFAMPTIPGLDSLQVLAQAIADALNATLVSELKGIANSIADCCVQIADAATRLMIATGVLESISRTLEACKCQDIGEALKRDLEPMKRALRDIMEFGWKDALEWGAIVAGFALSIAAMLEASIPLAILGALAAGAATVGLLMKLNEPTPEEDQESLDELKEEEKLRKSRERPIDEAPEHLRDHFEGIRQRDLERRVESTKRFSEGYADGSRTRKRRETW